MKNKNLILLLQQHPEDTEVYMDISRDDCHIGDLSESVYVYKTQVEERHGEMRINKYTQPGEEYNALVLE